MREYSEAVRRALREVMASARGSAHFETEQDAQDFMHTLYIEYPHAGYGTRAMIQQDATGFTVEWRVFSAD